MLELFCPAKINVNLRVLSKRADGFHEVETTMVRLPRLADVLRLEVAEEWSFSCSDMSLPLDERNLVVRAAQAWGEAAGRELGFSVELMKRIPHGAGLGGGSSNAAMTLRGLNELGGNVLEEAKLLEIAADLGSDVPFFLGSGVMRCTGRGEKLEEVGAPGALPIVLLKPRFGVATAGAYQAWEGSRELPGISYAEQKQDWGVMVNDLERPVFEKHLFLAEMKRWLQGRREVQAAVMSGSGSTMIALMKSLDHAKNLIRLAKKELDPSLWAWLGWSEGAKVNAASE